MAVREVTAHHDAGHELPELGRDRQIETERLADVLESRRGAVPATGQRGVVGGRGDEQEERDGADEEQGDDGTGRAPDDELKHGGEAALCREVERFHGTAGVRSAWCAPPRSAVESYDFTNRLLMSM